MREILFRGRSYSDGKWHYGYYMYRFATAFSAERHEITDGAGLGWNCPAETIGQYTGLCDKNGKKIYEGDIVTYPDGDGGYEYCDETINSGVVTWGDESALFYITNNYSAEFPDIWDRVDEMEIIGNIHDKEATR